MVSGQIEKCQRRRLVWTRLKIRKVAISTLFPFLKIYRLRLCLLPPANEVLLGYVFTRVCHSVPGPGGGDPGPCPAGCVSQHALRQTPPSIRLLLRTVRILLECILVGFMFVIFSPENSVVIICFQRPGDVPEMREAYKRLLPRGNPDPLRLWWTAQDVPTQNEIYLWKGQRRYVLKWVFNTCRINKRKVKQITEYNWIVWSLKLLVVPPLRWGVILLLKQHLKIWRWDIDVRMLVHDVTNKPITWLDT